MLRTSGRLRLPARRSSRSLGAGSGPVGLSGVGRNGRGREARSDITSGVVHGMKKPQEHNPAGCERAFLRALSRDL